MQYPLDFSLNIFQFELLFVDNKLRFAHLANNQLPLGRTTAIHFRPGKFATSLAQSQTDGFRKRQTLNPLSDLGELRFQCFQFGLPLIKFACGPRFGGGKFFQIPTKRDIDFVLFLDDRRQVRS